MCWFVDGRTAVCNISQIDKDHHVKICDFGLSRVADAIVQLTGGRGTVQWMAPEGLASVSFFDFAHYAVIAHEDYKNAADIYSFGVVLWEMCARQVIYVLLLV